MEQHPVFIRNSALGGIVIPAKTAGGTTYNIASVNMDLSCFRDFYVELDFACNIVTVMSKVHISFQIFKQGNYQLLPLPVSSSFTFFRETENRESNAFSFSAVDCGSMKEKYCNYSVYVKIMGDAADGTTAITNPSLMAIIVGNK